MQHLTPSVGIEVILHDITSELKPSAKLNQILKVTQGILRSHTIIRVNLTFADDRILGLLKLLTELEPLKRHEDVKLPRSENAGSWLLTLDSYIKWRNSNTMEEGGHVFCCYGIPGAGKTVIR